MRPSGRAHARRGVGQGLSPKRCRQRSRVRPQAPHGIPGRDGSADPNHGRLGQPPLHGGQPRRVTVGVPDVLIYGQTTTRPRCGTRCPSRSPSLPLRRARRRARSSSSARSRCRIGRRQTALEVCPLERFGFDELLAAGIDREQVDSSSRCGACRELGIDAALPCRPRSRSAARRPPARERASS